MILSHPCIRYAHIAKAGNSNNANRVLVIGTTISMDKAGDAFHNEKLMDLLEYLEVVKHQYEGSFDSIEIRGTSDYTEQYRIPHFIPSGHRCVNGVCV
jgi:hypothetical protein